MLSLTAPACLALEPDELANHAIAVEQLDLLRINQRQEIEIEFRLGLVRQSVVDAALAKLLLRPLTAIVVAGDSRDPVALQGFGELGANLLG